MIPHILVTGATGFVGSHLCHQARLRGWRVTGLKRATSRLEGFDAVGKFYENHKNSEIDFLQKLKASLIEFADNDAYFQLNSDSKKETGSFSWIDCDLNNQIDVLDLLETPFDFIFHTAAAVSFDRKNRSQIIEDNVGITRNLVNAALIHKQKKLIHISSIAALGRPIDKELIDINTQWTDSEYNTGYALSKYLSEMEVWRAAHEGLEVLVVNPGVILGYSSIPSSSSQVVHAAQNKIPFVPAGANGFVFVEDLVHRTLNLSTLQSAWSCRHMMVSHNIPFKNLIENINLVSGIKRNKIALKQPIWGIIWFLVRSIEFLGISMPLSSELLKSTRKISRYENRLGQTQSKPFV